MKKFLGVVILLAIAGAGGMYYLSLNAGGYVKDGVEEYVPPMLGAGVALGNVTLDPANGYASLQNMTIGNPDGFKSDHLFKMDELQVKMDVGLENLTSDVIRINEIRMDGADMIYEIGSGGNNVGKIQENIDAYITSLGIDMTDDSSEKKFIVDDVYINDTNVKLASDLLGGKGVSFPLPNLHIEDIGKRENGAIASDVIKQVFATISGSVTDVAQGELLKNTVGDVKGAAENAVKDLEDKVGKEVGNKLKGLLPPM
ncbi:MAG: hypothetical protein P8J14_08000 [Emcibacteraceae bacterium]|nr:hypothetical protein [Emcibacteraceae bacterium]